MSGGMDSAACAHLLAAQGHAVQGIFVDFGQAAREQESRAVSRLADLLGVATTTLNVGTGSCFGAGELVGRNAFLLMTAIFLGRAHDGLLAIGIHAGTPYYDCSAGFIDRLKVLTEEHTEGRLTVTAPFLQWTKGQIYEYVIKSGLPVDATYSCESGTIPPCGSCASCHDRRVLGC
ncbi:MAG: 7-cyano-7-deazaguanine synthase [Geminicoccaceae bacterium]|nr:7-cyano-7-deazaguanine synthase [Geminicoccaceae bacterium]